MILYDQNIPDSSLISYFNLTDKPSINGIILDGSLSLNDLGITSMNTFNQQTELFRLDLSSLRGSKQDKLISGVNIKTVNGQDLLGNGNVSIEVPVKSVNGMVGDVVIDVPSLIPANYVTDEELNAKNYLTEIPANYITYDKLYAEDYISKSVARDIIRWEFDERSKAFVLKTDVDDSLNDKSINPVQNKVVTLKFNQVISSHNSDVSTINNNISHINYEINNLKLKDTSHDTSIIANTNAINYINTQRIPEVAQLLINEYIHPINQEVTTVKEDVSSLQNEIDIIKGDGQGSIGDLENRVQAIEDGSIVLQNYIEKGSSEISSLTQITKIQIVSQEEYDDIDSHSSNVLYIIKK